MSHLPEIKSISWKKKKKKLLKILNALIKQKETEQNRIF